MLGFKPTICAVTGLITVVGRTAGITRQHTDLIERLRPHDEARSTTRKLHSQRSQGGQRSSTQECQPRPQTAQRAPPTYCEGASAAGRAMISHRKRIGRKKFEKRVLPFGAVPLRKSKQPLLKLRKVRLRTIDRTPAIEPHQRPRKAPSRQQRSE